MKIVSKKHWYSYSLNIFLILLAAIWILFNIRKINIDKIPTEEMTTEHSLHILLLISAIYIFFRNINSFILKTRVKWIFENNALIIKAGLLPWRRTNFNMNVNQIYDIYYDKSFLGSILDYAHIFIRRTDGTTSKFDEVKMTNAKKLTQTVSNTIEALNAQSESQNQINLSPSRIADELKKLANLKNEAVITENEFELLKRKIIDG